MEPSLAFQNRLLAYLQEEFSRPVFDHIPESDDAELPYVALLDDNWTDDRAKDVRAWQGQITFEVFDLDEHGRTRVKALLGELDGLLHAKDYRQFAMADFRLDWIFYLSSATARSGGDSRFRGTITFVCRIESLEESTT